jgi:hypothetical protein
MHRVVKDLIVRALFDGNVPEGLATCWLPQFVPANTPFGWKVICDLCRPKLTLSEMFRLPYDVAGPSYQMVMLESEFVCFSNAPPAGYLIYRGRCKKCQTLYLAEGNTPADEVGFEEFVKVLKRKRRKRKNP